MSPDRSAQFQPVIDMLQENSPDEWRRLDYLLWYEAPDVLGMAFWVDGERGAPPRGVSTALHRLRSECIAAGDSPWLRCELTVRRSSSSGVAKHELRLFDAVGDLPPNV